MFFTQFALRLLLVASLFHFLHSGLKAQEGELLTEAPDQYRIYGKVVDAEGQPIADARISLVVNPSFGDFMSLFHRPALARAVRSDDRGEFDLQLPGDDPMMNFVDAWTPMLLFAQAKGFSVALRKVDRERLLVDLPIEVAVDDSESFELTVLDGDGQPVEGVSVSPASIASQKIPFNTDFFKEFRTDANGVVSIADCKPTNEYYLSSEKIGNHRLPVATESGSMVLRLPPTGAIKGKISLPDGVDSELLDGKEVFVVSGNLWGRNQEDPQPVSWQLKSLNRNAEVEFDHMVFGTVSFGAVLPKSFPFCYSTSDYQSMRLTANNTPLEVSQNLYEAHEIRLRFVDENGKPVDGIRLSAFGELDSSSEDVNTIKMAEGEKLSGQMFPFDPTGRFQTAGNSGLHLGRLEFENSEAKPVTLIRSRSVKGRVVDEQGQVVAGAKVDYTIKKGTFTVTSSVLSNKSGEFRVNGLPQGSGVKLTATKGNSATPKEVSININAGSTEVAEVPVASQQVASFVGTVKTQNGQPVADAHVRLFKAGVFRVEGFSAEDLGAVDLVDDFEGVKTNKDGEFRYPATTLFKERIQVAVSAPGYREYRHPFIDGSRKEVEASEINLGAFELFKLPAPETITFKIVSTESEAPIANAQIVLFGIDSGKRLAKTNDNGNATINALDAGQLLAVKADDFALHLEFIEKLANDATIALEPMSFAEPSLRWLDRPWQEYHASAQSLVDELDVPAPKASTFYRQNTYFRALVNTDYSKFKDLLIVNPDVYEHQQSFLLYNADSMFLNDSMNAVEYLSVSSLPPEQKVALLGQSAMLCDDHDLKEEVYGEAIVLLGECSGTNRQFAAGQLASCLVLDGNVDIAKELISEEWSSAAELREQLQNNTEKKRIAESRVFIPLLALIEPDAAVRLMRLTARGGELPDLLAQCVTYASIAGFDVDEVCERHEIEKNLGGLSQQLSYATRSLARYDRTASWLLENLEFLPRPEKKVGAIMFAARHESDGGEKRNLVQQAVAVERKSNVAHQIVTELPKYKSFPSDVFDSLLFEELQHAPDKTESMQMNTVFGNLFKLIAIREPDIAKKLLDPAFENGAWLYGDPTWSPFEHDNLLKAYAWVDPKIAAEKARELANRYATDDEVRRLQLFTKVIGELNDIAIRKGMLQGR